MEDRRRGAYNPCHKSQELLNIPNRGPDTRRPIMNTYIKMDTDVSTVTDKLTILKQDVKKTKTILGFHFTKKDMEVQESVYYDIALMKLEGTKVKSFMITVEDAKALGRITNRAVTAFGKLGFEINELEWDATAGVIMVEGDMSTHDLPFILKVWFKLIQRATKQISHTHHALTLFDLKQMIGLTQDIKDGKEGTEAFEAWFKVRELLVLEEVEAKTKTASLAVVPKAKAKAKPKTKAKAKAKTKTKTKIKTASLHPVAEEETETEEQDETELKNA